jgi:DNA-binding transcriptional ArsR family regulator
MKDETFMLLSMKDSKNVANAMSNETAQKIISFLAEHKEATESELSKKLKIPLPTVHYNIQQLKKAKLIDAKEFFWSKKGKEMLVYKLAKKYIIISPDNSENSLSKLKSLLPVTLLSLVGSGAIYLWQKSQIGFARIATDTEAAKTVFQETAGKAVPGADVATNLTSDIITQTIGPNLALWFLAGSLFVILVFLLFSLLKKK